MIITIKNDDLKNGTYIINKPGLYKLVEDIIFHPNPDNNFQPKEEQSLKYPKNKGYVLGFFAAFVFEAENIIFDLNGHTLQCSKQFNLKQRFFSLIELASSPFIPKQGPANFGDSIVFAKNCVIKNGIFGLTPHHGIHGNGMSNIQIKNLLFRDYEVAGISLNGGKNIIIEKCKLCGTSQDVKMVSSYSQCHFGLRFLKKIVARDPNLIVNINSGPKTVQQIYDDVENEINKFDNYVLHGGKYKGIFKNKSKIMDDNVYGIALNSMGVLVNNFKNIRTDETIGNENIYLKNIIIENTFSKPIEILGLFKNQETLISTDAYGKNEYVGPVGDVFDFTQCMDENGFYKEDVLGNMQLAIAMYGKEAAERGTCNIDEFLCNTWITGYDVNLKELCNNETYYIVNGQDSMGHVMKGNIGLFISQGLNINVENIIINGVINLGTSQNTNGSQSIGIAICGSKDVSIKNKLIKNIKSSNSYQEKIKLINLNENISIY